MERRQPAFPFHGPSEGLRHGETEPGGFWQDGSRDRARPEDPGRHGSRFAAIPAEFAYANRPYHERVQPRVSRHMDARSFMGQHEESVLGSQHGPMQPSVSLQGGHQANLTQSHVPTCDGPRTGIPQQWGPQATVPQHGASQITGPRTWDSHSDVSRSSSPQNAYLPYQGLPPSNMRPQEASPFHMSQQGVPSNMPRQGAPPSTISFHATPMSNVPHHRALPSTMPQHGAPPSTMPQHGAPPSTMPQHGAPPSTMPQHGAPPSTMPQHGAPPSTMPQHGAPPSTMPQHGAPHSSTPHQWADPANMPPFAAPLSMMPPREGPVSQIPQPLGSQSNLIYHESHQSYQREAPLSKMLQDRDPQSLIATGDDLHPNSSPFAGSYIGVHHRERDILNPKSNLVSSEPGIPPHGAAHPVLHQVGAFGGPISGVYETNPVIPKPVQQHEAHYVDPFLVLHRTALQSPYPPAPSSAQMVDHRPSDDFLSQKNQSKAPFAVPDASMSSTAGESHKQNDFQDPQLHPQNTDHFVKEQRLYSLSRQSDNVQGMGSSDRVSVFKQAEEQSKLEDDIHGQRDVCFMQRDSLDMQRFGDLFYQKEDSFLFPGRSDVCNENPGMTLNMQRDDTWISGDCAPSHKDMFQNWLSSFLAQRKPKQSPKPECSPLPTISEARELIYSTLRLLSQLRALCKDLESSVESKESWAKDFPKVSHIRSELQKRMKTIEEPGFIENAKRKMGRVRKKRLRQQRAKQETEEDKKAAEEAAEREARIDQWRMRCIQEVEEKKRERELKATADRVLSEVRKKQADTKKMLDVLKSLEKLRKLRKEAAGRKGVFPPQSADETFENHIKRLRTMVNKRVALYDTEERALNVILEGEQEEERKKDKEKRTKKEREKFLQMQQKVDSILFGDPDPLPLLHPLQPFRQFYLQAENSVVSLVQIRHEWDRFLVPPDHPDGSSIPRGWVTPKSPSSQTWATAVQQME